MIFLTVLYAGAWLAALWGILAPWLVSLPIPDNNVVGIVGGDLAIFMYGLVNYVNEKAYTLGRSWYAGPTTTQEYLVIAGQQAKDIGSNKMKAAGTLFVLQAVSLSGKYVYRNHGLAACAIELFVLLAVFWAAFRFRRQIGELWRGFGSWLTKL